MTSSKKQKLLNFIFTFSPIYKYKIIGNSMLPGLKNGDIILINRLSYLFKKPKLNDIIAARDPRDNKILIKRITKIRANKYFIQGDNKKASTDSHIFGMIEKKNIIGKIIKINKTVIPVKTGI